MTREQAKTEIMQIYGSLSEEKKMALDVLMAQNCDQCEVGNPCLYCEYEFKAQADNIPVMYYPQVDGITPTVVAQADGEYISRQDVLAVLHNHLFDNVSRKRTYAELKIINEELKRLPTVAIPPDHDGCKDCKYETYPEYYYPCCECKQNYKDEWQKKPHWIDDNENELDAQYGRHLYKCSECNTYANDYVGGTEDWWDIKKPSYCPNCGARMFEPQESEDKE